MGFRSRLRDEAPQWDRWDWLVLAFVGGVGLVGWAGLLDSPLSLPTPSHSIAILTAGTVFYGQYRLRHPNQRHTVPPVRPEYEDAYSSEVSGYGLKNFGPGPALYLQVKARTSSGDEVVLLRPHDRPTHLEEGQFLSLTNDHSRSNNETLHLLTEGEDSDSEMQFYYSYVSQAGVREPIKAMRLTEQDDENILPYFPMDEHQTEDARSIGISELRRHLEPEPEAGR